MEFPYDMPEPGIVVSWAESGPPETLGFWATHKHEGEHVECERRLEDDLATLTLQCPKCDLIYQFTPLLGGGA
jgi:hypothetical protein